MDAVSVQHFGHFVHFGVEANWHNWNALNGVVECCRPKEVLFFVAVALRR